MKIETTAKNNANQTVKYSGGIRVTYNARCIAEVPDEVGASLIEKYQGQVFPEGKVVVAMERTGANPAISSNAADTIQELKEKLQKANFLINDYKAQVNLAQENERVWRLKCNEVLQQLTILQKGNPTVQAPVKKSEKMEKEEPIISTTDQDEVQALRSKLNEKNVKELLNIAAQLKLPADEYVKFGKNKLVDYLLERTTNAHD